MSRWRWDGNHGARDKARTIFTSALRLCKSSEAEMRT